MIPQTIEEIFDLVLAATQGAKADNNAAHQASALLAGLRERFFTLQDYVNAYTPGPTVVCVTSLEPPEVAGGYIAQLIERAGGRHELNPTRESSGRSAGLGAQTSERRAGPALRVSRGQIAAADPDAVLVALPGVALEAAKLAVAESWLMELRAARRGRLAVLEGDLLHDPGPGVLDAFAFLVGWLNGRPELIPPGFSWASCSTHIP